MTRSWDEIRGERSLDPRRVAAVSRLVEAEQALHNRWELRGQEMNWVR
jgi:hypothetical protein